MTTGHDIPGGWSRPYGQRLLAIAAVLGLAAGPGVLVPARAAPAPGPGSSPTAPAPAASTGQPAGEPGTDRGAQLYLQSCASCHGPQGQGTQRGPSLVGVGPASVDFQLGTGRMPLAREQQQPPRRKPAFSAADIRAIVTHVSSFGDGGPLR